MTPIRIILEAVRGALWAAMVVCVVLYCVAGDAVRLNA